MDTLESFANRLEEAAAGRDDVTLFGVDYMAVPLDEDGVPWHIGDEMLMDGEVCEVVGIGDEIILYAFEDGVEWTRAAYNRHYVKRDVEDVLRKFAGSLASTDNNWGSYVDEAVAEYAKLLRLVEDDCD